MNKGFTLTEMLVAMAIFSIIIGAAIGVFVSALKVQRYNLAYQELLNQTSYVIEYMGRAIRMARKDINGDCLTIAKTNYENPGGDTSRIDFLNYKGDCQSFFLEGGQLKESKGGSDLFLTSSDFEINSLKFNLIGQNQTDNLQPKVTIFLEIKKKGSGSQPSIKIQTTISQRNLDVQI